MSVHDERGGSVRNTRTLSEQDRDAAIDRLYDVALDPARYEALLDHWESAVGPLRADVDLHAPRLLDDPLIIGHFKRATTFLDRLKADGETSEIEEILAPFDRVAAFVLNEQKTVCATNHAAREVMGVNAGEKLTDLPINSDDIDEVVSAFYKVLSSSPEDTALLRVRAKEESRITILRLQRCHTRDGTPLVLAASNEVVWNKQASAILRKAFGLTSAETEVVHALVDCCSLNEIASQRGRSVDTIRAQIKSIMGKTSTHSQVELVRLAISMMDLVSRSIESAASPQLIRPKEGKLKDIPFQSLVTPDGRRLDYVVLGDPKGRPMLFMPMIYGVIRWPASAEAEAMQRGIRIIVPIRAGYGHSDMTPKGTDYDATLIADTLQILETERVERCPIVTFALDSYYMMRIALARPGLLTGAVCCAGVLPLTHREQYERMEKWHRFLMAGAKYTPHIVPFLVKAGFLMTRKMGKRGFLKAIYGKSPLDLEIMRDPEVIEAILTGGEITISEAHSAHEGFSAQLLGTRFRDWSDDLLLLKGAFPIIFMNGVEDPEVPMETLKEFQKAFDWIEFRVFEDAGQMVHFKHWRHVLDTVEDFLPPNN